MKSHGGIVRVLLALLLLGGCKCDSKLGDAVKSFVGFSKGKGEATPPPKKPTTPTDYALRRWSEDIKNGRSRATAEIEVNQSIDREALHKVLTDACHDDNLLRGSAVVKVIAWPGKLEKLGAILGTAVFARDGHGWEGSGVGFEDIQVNVPSDDQMAQRGLSPVSEEEYLMILGIDNMLKRGMAMDAAIQTTAERQGVDPGVIQAAVRHAGKLWGMPATAVNAGDASSTSHKKAKN